MTDAIWCVGCGTRHPLPLCKTTRGENLFDLVRKDLLEREQHGIRTYGKSISAGDGTDYLREAYEEVLDLALYLKGQIEERRTDGVPARHGTDAASQ